MSNNSSSQLGLFAGLAAFGLWGVTPVYFKLVTHVAPTEIISHRFVWTLVLLSMVLGITRKWRDLAGVLLVRRNVVMLGTTAALISVNWLVYIWAVGQGKILETSLGYFISPLVSVMLGMLFLGERLRPGQWLAVILAAIGVAYQLIDAGNLPWIGLVLALTFGVYGLVRKKVSVEPITGLMVEVLILAPFALLYLVWLEINGDLSFIHAGATTSWLMILTGLVTGVPLLLFSLAVNHLTLAATGLFNYLTPSISFLLAILVYHEPFDSKRLLTFGFIWAGLFVFTVEGLRRRRGTLKAAAEKKPEGILSNRVEPG